MTLDFEAFVKLPKEQKRRIIFEGAKHYVYRCYDADGVLLYIGCSNDVEQRIALHMYVAARANASWWLSLCMDRYEIEGPYRTRTAGRKAEAKAIRAEQPVFNSQGRGTSRFLVRNGVAQYLIAHGHRGVATETACTCRDGLFGVDEFCAAHDGQAVA
jgi:hypothetical protein